MKRFMTFLCMLAMAALVLFIVPESGVSATPISVTSGAHSAPLFHWGWLAGIVAALGPLILGMADVTSNVERIMKERLEPNLPEAYATDFRLVNFLDVTEGAVKVSEKAMRLVLEVSPGGETGSVNLDGGDNLSGGRSLKVQPTINCKTIAHARNVTRLAHLATKSSEQALFDDLKREVARALKELKLNESQFLNISTDGILAHISDIAAAPTYALDYDDGTNPFGAYLLREGNSYDVYDDTAFPATPRIDGPYRVAPDGGLDFVNQTVTFDQGGAADDGVVTGDTNDDVIVIQGMADAALQGLPYHLNTGTSGTWQTINRTKRYARVEGVDALGNDLTTDMLYRLKAKIMQRRNSEEIARLTPYYGPAQDHAYRAMGDEVVVLNADAAGGNKDFDLLFGQGSMFSRKGLVDNFANPNKIMWLDKAAFIKAEVVPLQFFKDPGTGQTLFNKIGANGVPSNNIWFQVEHRWNLGARHLETMGVIENLNTPDNTYVGFLV